ncbi:MAG: lipid A deacylase LpxR family protein [Rickettsiales bacterium]
MIPFRIVRLPHPRVFPKARHAKLVPLLATRRKTPPSISPGLPSLAFAFICLLIQAASAQTPLPSTSENNASLEEVIENKKSAPLRRDADDRGVVTVNFENDVFSGSDDGYTNGARIAWLSPEKNLPYWIERGSDLFPFFAKEGHKRYSFALGQTMFAPEDLTRTDLIKDDRPYAGFLYGSVGVLSDTGYRLDNLMLSLGMVGPSSLAEQTQKTVHSFTPGSVYPRGWENQLSDEPGVVLAYERKWRGLYEFSPFGPAFDVTPQLGGMLGNVYTNATAGATFRFGYDLPADYGPPLIRPSLPGSDFFVPSRKLGWYLFAGLEARAVARDIFLDGNSFRDSHSVNKNIFVGGAQTGVALTYKNTRVAYTHAFRTKEFEQQKDPDMFGALTLSVRF